MKNALKSTLLILALCISATQLFSNYYGDKTENSNAVEIPEKGFHLSKNYKQQQEQPNRNLYSHAESISSICRKN